MRLVELHGRAVVLVIVHPNFIIDHYKLSAAYTKMDRYISGVRGLIEAALSKGTHVIVSWLPHGYAEPEDYMLKHISVVDGDYQYDDTEAAREGGWTGSKWSMVGVKNKELYEDFLAYLQSIDDVNFSFYIEQQAGEGIKDVISQFPQNTRVIVAGGYKDACLPQTVAEIVKFIPKTRLMTKYVY